MPAVRCRIVWPILAIFTALGLGAALAGQDSRPGLDDEPHRAI